jgi:hypothetical protein
MQFKVRCHNCGKYGHKGANCPNKKDSSNGGQKGGTKSNGKGGFKGNCNHCKKYGHKEADCFMKKKEQGKELASNAVKSNEEDEVVLLALEREDLKDYVLLE